MSYLDTSVLAAYYCPEPLSKKVQKALDQISEPTISPLVELEMHSALAGKVRSGELDTASAAQILAMLQVHLSDRRYRIVPIGAREYALCRSWLGGCNLPLRTLDALHLAAAFANDLTLVSAEKILVRCAGQLGVKHHLIA
jgi:predicted nucleic acid-binding protein